MTLALAAFSPPQVKREPAQQEPPKSWIPERTPDAAPPVTALVDQSKQPSAYSHPVDVVCSSPANSGAKVAREFAEAYTRAKAALDSKRPEDAIALIEIAAAYARDGPQWMAIEGIRIAAFSRLKNDKELIASLEAALSTGCLEPVQRTNYREILDAARDRLAAPSPP